MGCAGRGDWIVSGRTTAIAPAATSRPGPGDPDWPAGCARSFPIDEHRPAARGGPPSRRTCSRRPPACAPGRRPSNGTAPARPRARAWVGGLAREDRAEPEGETCARTSRRPRARCGSRIDIGIWGCAGGRTGREAVGQRRLRDRRAFVAQQDHLGVRRSAAVNPSRVLQDWHAVGHTDLRAHRIEIKNRLGSARRPCPDYRPWRRHRRAPAHSTRNDRVGLQPIQRLRREEKPDEAGQCR